MNDIPNLNKPGTSLVRRLTAWLLSRRIMRRVLLGVAVLITLVAGIYARVNMYGQSEWEKTKRALTAKGEVLDWSAYAPSAVADDQNIFKAPKMAEWFGDERGLISAPFEQRITNAFAGRLYKTLPTTEIKTPEEAARYLASSDQFQQDFETIAEALKRPYARLVTDYSHPLFITFPNLATLHAVVKTLVLRAKCHLLVGQADKAWQELSFLHEFHRMVDCQGKFITTEGAWMRRELARHSLLVIAKGLELHAWQKPQLAVLQQQLQESDFIALFADALRCGRALAASSMELGPGEEGNVYREAFMAGGNNFWARTKHHPEFLLIRLAPRGAMYERATATSEGFQIMLNALSPSDGVFRPAELDKAFKKWKRAQAGLPTLLQVQSQVNAGQIACALECARLANGAYPETLDALTPQFMAKLPRDLINGQPFTYRRLDAEHFLLYSVGWNGTDDGGKAPTGPATPESVTAGDWVWGDGM